jgi:hypothetical protein
MAFVGGQDFFVDDSHGVPSFLGSFAAAEYRAAGIISDAVIQTAEL